MSFDYTNSQKLSGSILPGAEPIYRQGNDIGVLFIHGFTAAPYEGRYFANWLQEALGCTFWAPLLPGHGTRPEDLKGIRWQEWYNFIEQKYFELREQCRFVFVCGQSMGGTLTLLLSSRQPVDGIITLAGAVFLKDWRLCLLPIARHILPFQYKSKGPDVRNNKLKGTIPTYSKYPVRSIDELLGLLEQTRQRLSDVTAPALLMHSNKDRTVHFDNLNYIYQSISSTIKEKQVLDKSYHLISLDVEADFVFQRIQSFIQKVVSSVSRTK